ncbi:MAG: alpha/beta hydrolase family protein [Prevotella sp.]
MKTTLRTIFIGFTLGMAVCTSACSSDGDDELVNPPTETDGDTDSSDNTDDTGNSDNVDDKDNDVASVDSVELWSERDGKRIFGIMFRKSDSTEKVPAVVLSHSSSLTHKAMLDYARSIASEGYAAYCFDFCGGSSSSKSDGSTDDMTIFTEVEDLRAVVKTIKAESYVDADKVFLLGSSQGGLVSALLADEIPNDVAGMILFYPAFNIPEMVSMFSSLGDWGGIGGSWGGFGGMMTMSEAYINSIKDYDVWAHVGKFDKPVCIVHGTNDIIVNISYSEKAEKQYANAVLHKIEGANHGFNEANLGSFGSILGGSTNYDDVVMPIVLDFIEKNK